MAPFKIFYTDDDEDDQLLFEEIINNIDSKHEVQFQSHGEELMDMLKQDIPAPDLIFLDLNMPHKNGFEVLKEMRDDDSLTELPVVVFSTSNQADTIKRCEALGANGYICKPTSFTDMKKMLEKVLAMDWRSGSSKKNDFFYLNK